jgi:hypothetical protein
LPYPPATEAPVIANVESPSMDTYRFWVRAEYLGWWVKHAPQPISLVTGDPNNPDIELLSSSQSFGMFSGFRFGIGLWLDPCNTIGLETNSFYLQRRTRSFQASSDDTGDPTLAFPFINQTPGAVGDTLMPITSPGQFAGTVLVSSSLQLWGAELNGAFTFARNNNVEWIGLLGFRYVDLRENLSINTVSADIATNPSTVLVQSDSFSTRNQFYGGQLGTRLSWQDTWLGFDVTGKLALGPSHQVVDIQGVSSQTGPGGINGTFPGGFFVQGTNIGRFTANQLTVIPAVELKVNFTITPHLRAFVGYDFMYWNQVVRPGSQVDRNINLSQSAVFGSGVLSGPANPAPLFNRTDFWAQGVTFGLELRF